MQNRSEIVEEEKADSKKLTTVVSRPYHPEYIRKFITPLCEKVLQSTNLHKDLADMVISYLSRPEVYIPADLSNEQILEFLKPYCGLEFVFRIDRDLPNHRIHEICKLIRDNISSSTSPIFNHNVNREDARNIRLLYNGIVGYGVEKIGFFSKKMAKAKQETKKLKHAFHTSPTGRQNNALLPFAGAIHVMLITLAAWAYFTRPEEQLNIERRSLIISAFIVLVMFDCTILREPISRVWREGAQDYNNQRIESAPPAQQSADNTDEEGFYDPEDVKGFQPL